MRIFAVDTNNDLFVGRHGGLAVRTGLEALGQTCEHVMKAILGEMVFSASRGLPYFETLWTGNPDLRAFEEAARISLRNVPGVIAVVSFSAEIQGNTCVYNAGIKTIYGDTIARGEVMNG